MQSLNKELLKDLFAVKAEIKGLVKSSENPFFKSKYVDLNTTLEHVEPILAQHGFIVLQPVEQTSLGDVVSTYLLHKTGESIKSSMSLVLVKNDMQAAGSAVTYARRYTLQSILSMRAEDNDAEEAVGRGTKTNTYVPKSSLKPAAPKEEAKEAAPVTEKKQSKFKPKLPEQPKETTSSDGGWN